MLWGAPAGAAVRAEIPALIHVPKDAPTPAQKGVAVAERHVPVHAKRIAPWGCKGINLLEQTLFRPCFFCRSYSKAKNTLLMGDVHILVQMKKYTMTKCM